MRILNSDRLPVDEPDVPEELARELQRQRELAAARRTDELERVRAEAGHGRARADVAEETRLAELARTEREADVRAEADLAQMYRQFRASGARTRIKADMARSGEARALRLEWLRTRNLRVLVPVLIGFGIWSTTGVQQGAAKIMDVDKSDPVWWTLWGLEALLIGAVCWIIIARARLAASGGRLASHAERIGFGCLTTSIFLNLIAAVPTGDADVSGWAVPGAMFAHALGPIGAAVTAHLIGVIDTSISDADPWNEGEGENKRPVPRLAEMDLQPPTVAPARNAPEKDTENEAAAEHAVPVTVWPVPLGNRPALTVIARPTPVKTGKGTGKSTVRTGGDRDAQPDAGTPRRPRPNKGVPVPEAAKPLPRTSRDRTDTELQEQLAELLARGEIEPGVRAVKDALGIGYDRAKRIMAALAEEVTGKADNADLGEVARPLTVVAGGAK
ncbi:hypothetical protein ETD83_20885 [Actinomadura soli]|uniref:DUF2637 domain-containing protein n=1 Tax=Actinomadura soli TaxID=2508997 RepID=A0A5C4JAY6_9ACTN|nr:hypothetical protein [Actinomadura soli]TMQ96813.1 hypothetical protein ETD83_20885 [Actinomadura soli]